MRIISRKDPKSPVSEAYRSIRTNIEFANIDEDLKVVMVTSSQQNEGKSTVIANLAVSFANLEDKRVLIIDGDLRNPTVHRMFGISNTFGVTDILRGNKDIKDCIVKVDIEGLDILSAGKVPPNPAEMLGSKRMKEFINSIKEDYDYVFIDAPPIGIVTDAGIISTYTDGTILVVASKETDVERVKISKERLERVNAKILGVILNKYEAEGSAYGYYGYYNEESRVTKKKAKKGLFGKLGLSFANL